MGTRIDLVPPGKTQLSDEENSAVQAELVRLRDELGGWRAVGEKLQIPRETASQTIRNAVVKRAGREVAERLYAYLGTTRDAFLAAREGGEPSPVDVAAALDVAKWSAAGLDAEAAVRVVTMIRAELAHVPPSRRDALNRATETALDRGPPARAVADDSPPAPAPRKAMRRRLD